jgi:hypothetical protein
MGGLEGVVSREIYVPHPCRDRHTIPQPDQRDPSLSGALIRCERIREEIYFLPSNRGFWTDDFPKPISLLRARRARISSRHREKMRRPNLFRRCTAHTARFFARGRRKEKGACNMVRIGRLYHVWRVSEASWHGYHEHQRMTAHRECGPPLY